jgi:hypothetical protein
MRARRRGREDEGREEEGEKKRDQKKRAKRVIAQSYRPTWTSECAWVQKGPVR